MDVDEYFSASNDLPYEMAAVIQGDGLVTNLEFHKDGNFLIMSTNQDTIHLIDVLSGEEKKKIHCKSSGISKMIYTHHEQCVVTAANKKSNDAKYICLYDNKVIRNFNGHTNNITSLTMSPCEDIFLSGSEDKTVKSWDLRMKKATNQIQLPRHYSAPIVHFDKSGLVYGVLAQNLKDGSQSLRIFDSRNTSDGPFQEVTPSSSLLLSALTNQYPTMLEETSFKPLKTAWLDFEFSYDGAHILVNTDSELLWMLDGFQNTVEPKIIGPRKNDSKSSLGFCFSTDSQKILVGNDDNNEILLYDKNSGELIKALSGHVSPVGCITYNQKYDVFASSCVNTALWLPKVVSN